jgi:hypothetical protein
VGRGQAASRAQLCLNVRNRPGTGALRETEERFMASIPPTELPPIPSQPAQPGTNPPAQPDRAPPEIVPTQPDIDIPDATPAQPDVAPGQPYDEVPFAPNG